MILHPLQQYFSHIRTRAGDNEMLCANGTLFTIEKVFASDRAKNPGPLAQ